MGSLKLTGYSHLGVRLLSGNNLKEKGFIEGEFTPGAYAAFAILPQPIHFVRGKITTKGQEYLAGLKQNESDSE